MDTTSSATSLARNPLANKDNATEPRLVVPSCCGIPKRATDLCDHFQIRPPIAAFDGE